MPWALTLDMGSTVAATHMNGNVNARIRYAPFGLMMDDPKKLRDGAGFTGHLKDSETGLNYMQARYYDPVMGRFLSVDPVGFVDTGEPSYFNRYRYCSNDPVNCMDPTGMNDEGWIPDWFSNRFKEESSQALNRFVESSMPAGSQMDTGNPDAAGQSVMNPNSEAVAYGAMGGATMAAMDGMVEGYVQSQTMAIGGPGPKAVGQVGALTARAKKLHSVLGKKGDIAFDRRTTAVVETAEGGIFVASSEKLLSVAQRASLRSGEIAVPGLGHAELTAMRAAQAVGQNPIAVGASRTVCPSCRAVLKANGVKF